MLEIHKYEDKIIIDRNESIWEYLDNDVMNQKLSIY